MRIALASILLFACIRGGAEETTPSTFFAGSSVRTCIESLCGVSTVNHGGYNAGTPRRAASPLAEKLWNDAYLGNLTKALETNHDNDRQLFKSLESGIKAGLHVEASRIEAFRTLFLVYGMLGRVRSEQEDFVEADPATRIQRIDEDDLAEAVEHLDPAEAKLYLQIVRSFIRPEYTNRLVNDGSANDLQKRMAILYPKLPFAQALTKDRDENRKRLQDARSEYGDILINAYLPLDEQKILSSVSLQSSAEEAGRYRTAAEKLEVLNLSRSYLKALNLPNLSDVAEKVATGGAEYALEVQAGKADYETIKRPLRKCRNLFGLILDSTAKDARRLKAMVALVKAGGRRVVPQLIDGVGEQKRLIEAIDDAEFIFPERGSQKARDLRKRFASDAETALWRQAILKSPDADQYALLSAIFLELATPNSKKTVKVYAEESCKELSEPHPIDEALIPVPKVRVSWFTQSYPETGLGTLAHELGHIVTHEIRKLDLAAGTKFTTSRNCVANRNPYLPDPVVLGLKDDTEWSDEDWADHFATRVLRETQSMPRPDALASIPTTKNFLCAMVDDYINDATENNLTPPDRDHHSSSFLRLLLVSLDTNSRSPQCQPFYDFITAPGRKLRCE